MSDQAMEAAAREATPDTYWPEYFEAARELKTNFGPATSEAQLPRMVRALAGRLIEVERRLREAEGLAAPPEDADPGLHPFEAVQSVPTFRVRVQHSHTLKEGWRLSETTVEIEGVPLDDFSGGWMPRLRDHLAHAHGIAEKETERRRAPETGGGS